MLQISLGLKLKMLGCCGFLQAKFWQDMYIGGTPSTVSTVKYTLEMSESSYKQTSFVHIHLSLLC
jgi:hypothetical protein